MQYVAWITSTDENGRTKIDANLFGQSSRFDDIATVKDEVKRYIETHGIQPDTRIELFETRTDGLINWDNPIETFEWSQL